MKRWRIPAGVRVMTRPNFWQEGPLDISSNLPARVRAPIGVWLPQGKDFWSSGAAVAAGVKPFRHQGLADADYYTATPTITETATEVVTDWTNITERFVLADLRTEAHDAAEAEVLELINDAHVSESTMTRAGKAAWAALLADYIDNQLLGGGGAWAGTIKPMFLTGTPTYAELIAYIRTWREDLPAWPAAVPKPKG